MSQPGGTQSGRGGPIEAGPRDAQDGERSGRRALLVSAQPLAQHAHGAAFHADNRRLKVPECAVTIVGRALDAGEPFTP